MDWRISPAPFPLGEDLAKEIESLGRVLLQFYRAVNLLYRKSQDQLYDPEAERGLGNHPQAYSHLGLIRCALLLEQRTP